ncbi:MAG: biotin/lipoyl-binding protein, partial [Caldisericaceae bacterium]|nr:biotin/lipoyl-binding protein [Caldisericaceae bacterium]
MKNLKNKWLWVAPILVIMIALLVILIQALHSEETIVLGMVETTEIDLAAKIPGRVDSLLVKEGQLVQKGQLLATLESKEIDAKVAQARSVM